MMRYLSFILIMLFSVVTFAQYSAQEVDHVALAARLVSDGHYDRAKSVLTGVFEPENAGDRADFHTVLGLVALHESDWRKAIEHFEKAMFAGKTDDVVFVYLAQAYWGLQDYESTLLMIRNAEEHARASSALQMVRTQALWKLGRLHSAWDVLQENSKKFISEVQFERLKIFLLIELGLYQEASVLAASFVDGRNDVEVDDYLAFGQALLASGQTQVAQNFLERANLRFQNDPRVTTQLARTLLANSMPIAAGELLQRVAVADEELLESAEMFRRGEALDRALYMNSQVVNQRSKLRQRVGILTDRQDFEGVAAMEERLERVGVLDDQNVVYGVAYARFQIADYQGAERLLKRISDASLFESATRLRQVMAYCAENPC